MSICSRPGCTKQLRSNNTSGVCGSGCRSPEAPPSQRDPALDDDVLDDKPKKRRASDTMKNFRAVASALGKDPDAILEEAAEEWLAVVRKAVE